MPDELPDPAAPVADFRKAVADAADIAGKLWLSELGVLFYTGLAVAGIKHVDLLEENGVKLPFLDIGLSLTSFFLLGPVIVILAHAYVLHHLTILARKTGSLMAAIDALPPQAQANELVLLPISLFVQILIGPRDANRTPYWIATIVAWTTLVLGPVCLLALMQLQFLPYHDQALTWWGRIAVLLDLGLIWWLWPQVSRIPTIGWRGLQVTFMRVFTVAACYLVFAVATFPGEWIDTQLPEFPLHESLVGGQSDGELHASRTIFSNRLFVAGVTLPNVESYDTPEKRATAPVSKSLRGRHLELAILTEAHLGRVDLTDAHLEGASLVRAHAEGAWFDHADLTSAQLDGAELEGASFYQAQMAGTTLADANLEGARLAGANLQAAWLGTAHLNAASLASADLRRATLDKADLSGSSLNEAKLQGASLVEADLEAASLTRAAVWKADFSQAKGGAFVQVANLNTDPDAPCDPLPAEGCSADLLRKKIERNVPDSGNRTKMINRLWTNFDAHKQEPWELQTVNGGPSNGAYVDTALLQKLKAPAEPTDEAKRDALRAETWKRIACVGKGAPYVFQILVDTYDDQDGWTRPTTPDGTMSLVKQIFDTKPPCAASLALTNPMKMDLMDLKREVKESPAPPTPPADPTTPSRSTAAQGSGLGRRP